MKIANCLLVKNENNYIKEHIDYYKSIGYDWELHFTTKKEIKQKRNMRKNVKEIASMK